MNIFWDIQMLVFMYLLLTSPGVYRCWYLYFLVKHMADLFEIWILGIT